MQRAFSSVSTLSICSNLLTLPAGLGRWCGGPGQKFFRGERRSFQLLLFGICSELRLLGQQDGGEAGRVGEKDRGLGTHW